MPVAPSPLGASGFSLTPLGSVDGVSSSGRSTAVPPSPAAPLSPPPALSPPALSPALSPLPPAGGVGPFLGWANAGPATSSATIDNEEARRGRAMRGTLPQQ